MLRIRAMAAILFFTSFCSVAVCAQENNKVSVTKEITGKVQSFSGDILDVWPATTPPVWITIPYDLKVDRNEVKPGTEVSVQARWVGTCYVAVKAPEMTATKSASR